MAGTIGNVLVDNAAVYIEDPAADGSGYALAGYTGEAEYQYEVDVATVDVHEETVPIGAIINTETSKFMIPFYEATLEQITQTIAGGSLSSDTTTLGGGTIQLLRIKLVTDDPDNSTKFRKIELFSCYPSGSVSLPHSRTGAMLIQAEFTAIKVVTYGYGQIVRNLATATS
jgi:hypothetical protein